MSFLKGLKREETGPTPGELRSVLSAMQRERTSLEAMVQRAEAASAELRAVQAGDSASLASSLGERIAALETQLRAVESLAPVLDRAATRLGGFDDAWDRTEQRLAELEQRAAKVTEHVGLFRDLGDRVPEAQHQVGVLRALVEQTTQKLSAFEQQRDQIDRASGQLGQIHGVLQQLDTGFRRQDELLASLRDLETRLSDTESAQRRVASETEALTEQHRAMATESDRARTVLETVRVSLEQGSALVDHEHRSLDALAQRVEEIRVAVKDCEGRLGSLNATSRHIVGLEGQAQHLFTEVSRLSGEFRQLSERAERSRGLQAEAARLEQLLGGVQLRVQKIEDARPGIETAIQDLGVLRGSQETLREALEQAGRTQQELARFREAQVETQAWLAKSDGATRAVQAQVERVGDRVETVSTVIADAERKMAAMGDTLDALRARAGEFEGLGERIRTLGEELAQREAGLERAVGQLARTTDLRREAVETAERLEDVSRSLSGALSDAEVRSLELDRLATELSERAGALGLVQDQLRQFDERLTSWQTTEREMTRAVDAVLSRQESVDKLQQDVREVYALAERTLGEVRTITEARREVEATARLLAETREQLGDTGTALQDLERRKAQVEKAEHRLARAEALALDLRASLESLHAQRAVIDGALEKAAGLGNQMRQAETVLESLREERAIADRVRAAVTALREEDAS